MAITANSIIDNLGFEVDGFKALDLQTVDAGLLVPLIKAVQDICAMQAAVHAEIERRALLNNEMLPGVVVKDTVTHRRWLDPETAAQLAQETIGDAAFSRTLLSPAQMEKLSDAGKQFVAVASFKPEGGRKVVY